MNRLAILTVLALAAVTATPARAVVMVFGGGMAEACSRAAFDGRMDAAAELICSDALRIEPLSTSDRAATFVNRGVMKLRRGEYEAARADFDASIALVPNSGEAFVNRGAVSVGEKRYKAGLADLNTAIELGVSQLEKAYFNRALAFEGLDDEKSAYFDYQQALTLKPDWDAPKVELMRFTVSRR
jgi:tetratricopeptide (TPR) repeat protein